MSDIQQKLESTLVCEWHGEYVSARTKNRFGSGSHWTPCPRCVSEGSEKACKKHGGFISRLTRENYHDDWSHCPECSTEEEEERAKRREEAEDSLRGNSRLRRHKQSDIPPRHSSCDFANYVAISDGQSRVVASVRAYAESFPDAIAAGRCLLLCGGVGTGKTHLAAATLRHVMDAGYTGLYATASEIIRTIRGTWERDSGTTEARAIAKYVSPDLLAIDEIGVQFGSESERTQLGEIIDMRYRNIKPTLVISNLPKDQLAKHIGLRAVDRLRENGGIVATFDWSSYRGSMTESFLKVDKTKGIQ